MGRGINILKIRGGGNTAKKPIKENNLGTYANYRVSAVSQPKTGMGSG